MTIDVTYDDVICIAPELEGKESLIEKLIPVACDSVSESVWGAKADWGVTVLTAHLATSFSRGGVGGEIKKKKVGDNEIEYGINSQSDDPHELSTTSYGKEFLRCRRTLVLTPTVAGC